MREIRQSGLEGGARFKPSSLPLSYNAYVHRSDAPTNAHFRPLPTGGELNEPSHAAPSPSTTLTLIRSAGLRDRLWPSISNSHRRLRSRPNGCRKPFGPLAREGQRTDALYEPHFPCLPEEKLFRGFKPKHLLFLFYRLIRGTPAGPFKEFLTYHH
jgi:hypothetical protein